jgi:hypothetical protein
VPEYDDDGGRADAARGKKACAQLLLDLRLHEAWPDEIVNEDVDRWPVYRSPLDREVAGLFASPSAMCSDLVKNVLSDEHKNAIAEGHRRRLARAEGAV